MKKTITTLLTAGLATVSLQAVEITITNSSSYGGQFAATPSWTIAGDSDISNNGTFVEAVNFNGASTTVNGVTFGATGTQITYNTDSNLTTSGVGDFDSLSASYQSLLSGAVRSNSTGTLIYSGLTIGVDYEIQFWLNDSSQNYGAPISYTGSGEGANGGSNRVFIQNNDYVVNGVVNNNPQAGRNNIATLGGLGSVITGTFTADATSAQINFAGTGETLNAAQLRVIPEPATYALMVGALAIGAVIIRRRRS